MMNNISIAGIVAILTTLILVGCKEEPKTPTEVSVKVNAPFPSEPGYEATLAEGIDFKKPGYPNFLSEVKGMSGREPWGRWSDAKQVEFKFKQPLPSKFTLVISGGGFGANVNKPVNVQVGGIVKDIQFSTNPFAPSEKLTPQRISFELNTSVDAIVIVVPQPMSTGTSDTRQLGIGLITLKIES